MRFRDDVKLDTSQVEDRRREHAHPHVDGGRTYGRPTPEQRLFDIARRMSPGTVGGLVRNAAPVQRPAPVPVYRSRTSKRWGSIVVAASDSLDASKEAADYVCDAADAAPVLLEAFNQATGDTTSGGECVLLEGTYGCKSQLTWWTGLRIRGMGPGTEVYRDASLNDNLLLGAGRGFQAMSGLSVTAHDTNTPALVHLSDEQDVVITECYFSANDDAPNLQVDGTNGDTGIRLLNNVFGQGGVYFATGTLTSPIPSGRSSIIGNVFASGFGSLQIVDSQALHVVGNHFFEDYGLTLDGCRGLTVADNTFFRSAEHIIKMIDSTRCLVHANVGLDPGHTTHNTYDGIILTSTSTYNKVTDNVLAATGFTKARNAVRLDAGSDNNIVAHNDVNGSYATAGVADAAAGTITWGGNRT